MNYIKNREQLVTGVSLFSFFVIMQVTTWLPLRYWHIWGGGNFIDSQQILQWSECFEARGNLVFSSEGECSGYMYGSTLLKILSFLKVDPIGTQILGYIFMFVLAGTVALTIKPFTKFKENPFIILILLSPPVLLLAERGNFDIVMFALICSAGILFGRNHKILALIPLALATLLKFYSFPLFILFFLLSENKKTKMATLAIGVAVSVRMILDLHLIQTSFPSGYSWKFGASIWTRYLTQLDVPDRGEVFNNLTGLLILLITVLVILVVLKKRKLHIPPINSGNRVDRLLFYALLLTHFSCFVLGMNFDYRLIFLGIASAIYLNSFCIRNGTDSNFVLVLTITCLWLTYPSTGLEPIGDLAIEVLTVYLGIRALKLVRIDLNPQRHKLSL